jgi:hypothetical protein
MVDYGTQPKLYILVISQHTPRMAFACGGHTAPTTMAAASVSILTPLRYYSCTGLHPWSLLDAWSASSMVNDVLVGVGSSESDS